MNEDMIRKARAAIKKYGSVAEAARQLKLPRKTLADRAAGTLTEPRAKNLNLVQEAHRQRVIDGQRALEKKHRLHGNLSGARMIMIPDCQVKPGVPLEHLEWCGKYIAAKRPAVIVCIGDFADMASLSSFDKGTRLFEGRRYKLDLEAAARGMDMLMTSIAKIGGYNPRLVLTYGNHEARIERATIEDPKLEGLISLNDLNYAKWGWQTVPFLEPIIVEGVAFCHYFPSGIMGRPLTSARNLLGKLHMSAVAGHQQGRDIAFGKRADGRNMTGIISGCLTPDHKVLTADLRYVPIGSVRGGDKLVSFDDDPAVLGGRKFRRRYKTGTVTAVARGYAPVFKVMLASGKEFKVTADHQWLTKLGSAFKWRTTNNLRRGTRIPRLFDEWEVLQSYDAGWLAGMYDGEGSLYARKTSGGRVLQLAISQKPGTTLDRIGSTVADLFGKTHNTWGGSGSARQLRINGGAPSIAKVLGSIRPGRLLAKFSPELLGNIIGAPETLDTVVGIWPLGTQEIVRSKVDAGTYIAEGYGHHNSFYQHDEDYLSPYTNNHWRGIWGLNEVKDGAFDEMPISLDYLKRKFG